MTDFPSVAVIIPCRNEEKFISECLDSLLANDYPQDRLEILVVDGMSDDGTREIVERYAQRHGYIRLLDNPQKITPTALNIGIMSACGEILLRMDAHATYEKNYIVKCVKALGEYGADNVGGVMKTLPQRESFIGKAIAQSLSHRFGVGNSYFRIHSKSPIWVDTVFGGCYRKETLRRVGPFNELLLRGQDMEFNLRLRRAGGRTLLVPDIVSYYYARSDILSFLKHNWINGVWAILPCLYSSIVPVSWRHLMPLVFAASLLASAAFSFISPVAMWLLAVIVSSYGSVALLASAHIAWRERDVRYVFLMPFIFGLLHISYGLGSLWGVMKVGLMPQFWRKLRSYLTGRDPRHDTVGI